MRFFSKANEKKALEAGPYLRRILDLTTPSRMRADEMRETNRYERGLPVAFCEWHRGRPIVDAIQLGLTRDISDRGVSILTTSKLNYDEAVFTILVDEEVSKELWFFHANIVRKCSYFGFVELGLKINEYLNDDYRIQLQPLIKQLVNAPPEEELQPSLV